MASHSRGSSAAGDILTETSENNTPYQNTDDEDMERPSELQTEYSADNESRSVNRDRTSESATPISRHYGEGDHIDNTSGDETSTEVSCKLITENTASNIVVDHKHETIHSKCGMTRYSSDFEPQSTARTAKSVSSLRYSDDFEPTTNSKTGRLQYASAYSENFESVSHVVETTLGSEDVSNVSHSVTVSRSETMSRSASMSTNAGDSETDVTDMTQNDVDDTEYFSDSDQSEAPVASQGSISYTDSYERTEASSRTSCHQQTDATATNISSGSDVKYSYDDDFTQHEEEEEEHQEEEVVQEEEEEREEREAAHQAEVAYIERKLQALKSGRVCRSPLTPHPPPQLYHQRIKNTKHLDDFCYRKLSLLKQKRQQSSVVSGRMETGGHEGSTLCGSKGVRHRESARCMYLGLEGSQCVDAHGMSSVKVRKLREAHAMGQIRKAAEARIHIPRKCPACQEKMAELAEEEFFRTKTAKMLARLLEQKFEKHLLKYSDTVGLIGELVHDLPTMRQAPSEITKQLLLPLENRPSVVTAAICHLKEADTLQDNVPRDPSEVWKAYMAPLQDSGWMPAKS